MHMMHVVHVQVVYVTVVTVFPSVCPSTTYWYCTKMSKPIIK